jgi:hypothetical protein
VTITRGTSYVTAVHWPSGGYPSTASGLATDINHRQLTATDGHTVVGGALAYPSTVNTTNYFIDVVYAYHWPTLANTGTTGVLTPSARVSTTSNGQTIENLIIDGHGSSGVFVTHDNCIVRNCFILNYGPWGVQATDGTGTTVEDCEFDGNGYGAAGVIAGPDTTIRRCNIYGNENGVMIAGGGVTVEDCVLHNLESPVPDQAHFDGIQAGGGWVTITLRRNAIYAFNTSDILLLDEFGGFGGVLIEDNRMWMYNGSANLYIANPHSDGVITDATVRRNMMHDGAFRYYIIEGVVSLTWVNNFDGTTGDIIPTPP